MLGPGRCQRVYRAEAAVLVASLLSPESAARRAGERGRRGCDEETRIPPVDPSLSYEQAGTLGATMESKLKEERSGRCPRGGQAKHATREGRKVRPRRRDHGVLVGKDANSQDIQGVRSIPSGLARTSRYREGMLAGFKLQGRRPLQQATPRADGDSE